MKTKLEKLILLEFRNSPPFLSFRYKKKWWRKEGPNCIVRELDNKVERESINNNSVVAFNHQSFPLHLRKHAVGIFVVKI